MIETSVESIVILHRIHTWIEKRPPKWNDA